MSLQDLIFVSDYARRHGILPAQAADMLSQLGMIGTANDIPSVIPSRAYEGRVLEVVL